MQNLIHQILIKTSVVMMLNIGCSMYLLANPINPPTTSNTSIDCGDAAPTLSASCTDCPTCDFDPATMSIAVSFSGNHTYVSDLSFYLQAPDGTIITLKQEGATTENSGNDYSDLIFTNAAGGNLVYATASTPLTGVYNSSDGSTIDWSPFMGEDVYSTGWNVIVGDCVGADVGDLDRAILTFSDNGGGASCLAGQSPIVYDSGTTPLNEALNDNECTPGVDNPAVFAVNIPEPVQWFNVATGGTAIAEGNDFNVAGSTAAEGAFDNNAGGTYTYYAECNCGGCTSTRVPVTVTVDCCDVAITSALAGAETCDGDSNGSIVINATSSNPPLMYSIDNGVSFQAGNIFTGLAPNTYNIVVQDAGGASCQETTTATVAAGPVLSPPTTANATIDCGDAAPTLSANCVDCPTCDFDPATMSIAVSFSGNHTYVSDLSFYLQAPDGTIITLKQEGATTENSGNDYSDLIFTNAAGGNLVYATASTPLTGVYNSSDGSTIDWSPFMGEDVYSTGWNVIVGDCVGADVGDLDRAILTFSDNGGGASCLAGQSPIVYDSGTTPLNEALNDNECTPGVDNPAVFAVNIPEPVQWFNVATGGTAIAEGNDFNVAGSTAAEGAFDNNTEGTYTYYVECSCGGCTSTRSAVTVTVGSCCDVAITSALAGAETCDGDSNGSIVINATSSNPPLMYSIDNGVSFQAGNIFTGLAPNTYNIVVQDAGGASCQETTTATVAAGPVLSPPTTANATIDCGDAAPTLSANCVDCPTCDFDPATMSIAVSFSGNHTYVSDLSFYLQAPDGTIITLKQEGATTENSGNDYSDLIFTNAAGGNLVYATASTPLTGVYNSSDGSTIDWSPFMGEDVYSTGWNVIVGDCVGADVGDLDRAILTFSDNGGGASCLAGQSPIVYDSGTTPLNEALNDNECTPGVDNPAVFAVNIPEPVQWFNVATGGTAIAEGNDFNVAGSTAAEGAFDNNTEGTYTYYVECSCGGCTSTRSAVTVTVGSCCDVAITSALAGAETCAGATDGTISINATTSNPPLMYSIDNGLSFQAGNTFTSLAPNTYNIVVQDAGGASCQETTTATVAAGIDCSLYLADPCSCLDNATPFNMDDNTGGGDGTFSELISIPAPGQPALPAGLTFTVVGGTTGAFDAYAVPAIGSTSPMTAIPTDGSITFTYDGAGTYELPFVHVESIGYTIFVEGPQPFGTLGNVVLTISNNCAYPNPTITEPALGLYCPDAAAVTMTGTDANPAESVNFLIDGTPAASFDPSALTIGDHTVTMIFNGIDNADGNSGISPDGGTTPALPGCTQTVTKTVTVDDITPPVCATSDITISLDVAGDASITAAEVDNNSSDNCNIQSLAVAPNTFTCANVGANPVVLTVTDINNNESTCNATVNVEDGVAPICIAMDITVQLDANGDATILATDVDNTSTDACGIQSLAIAPNTFTCANVGANSVVLTVTDINNNESTCNATVNLEDGIAPICMAMDITVQLDANGDATITGADVDNTSTDACGIQSLAVAPNTFTCANVGANSVVLTVTDINNNESTCNATVNLEDGIAPICIAQNITVLLDANGDATILATDVDNTSTDACGIQSLVVAPNTFTCADIGNNTVTLTVTDNNNNVSMCDATVTLFDLVNPDCQTQDITIQLDANGNVSIDPADIDNNSSDACGIASIGLDDDDFDCTDVGDNTVTLSVTDVNGNISTCTATVTVEDDIAPIAICQDLTVQLDANGDVNVLSTELDNGSNDACGIQTIEVNNAASIDLGCANVGGNTVTVTVTDNNDNSSDCTANITVQDNVAPTAICQDVTIILDADGNASTTASNVDNGSNDACGIASITLSQTDFNCANVGANSVVLTVTDNNSNVSTCAATVTVQDNTAPNVICRPDVNTCNDAGLCGANIILLDPFASDVCGIMSITNDAPDFFDVGITMVNWIITDNSGNTSTCEQIVSVCDSEPPAMISCNTSTDNTDNGNCGTKFNITANTTDNCGIASITGAGIFVYEPGVHIHMITVTDVNGLVLEHPVVITVHDTEAPTLVECPADMLVENPGLNPIQVTLDVPTFTDNCSGMTVTNDQVGEFTFPLGSTPVTWTAQDTYGNQTYCTYMVEVIPGMGFEPMMNIEGSIDNQSDEARVRWNAPIPHTPCVECEEKEYADFTYLGDFFGHQYFLFTNEEGMDWATANEVANNTVHGHLVSINNADENHFVAHYLSNQATEQAVWIGLSDAMNNEDGEYTWTNNDELTYANFGGETLPMNDSLNMVVLQADGIWTLADGNTTQAFLVERPCIELTQVAPVILTENNEGETIETLLTSGDNWPEGQYTVIYEATDMCDNATTFEFDVEVQQPTAEYCQTKGNTDELWIESVKIGTQLFAPTSTDDTNANAEGYTDRTDTEVNLTISTLNNVPLLLIPNSSFTANSANELLYWRVWQDLNNDGDFFDANELIIETTATDTIQAWLPQPATNLSESRVRIAVSTVDFVEVCAPYISGEVEDYHLTFQYLGNNDDNSGFDIGYGLHGDGTEELTDNDLHIYPNPATDKIYLLLPPQETQSTIRIYDVQGQLLREVLMDANTASQSLDLQNLANGIYTLEVELMNNQLHKRLIIQGK